MSRYENYMLNKRLIVLFILFIGLVTTSCIFLSSESYPQTQKPKVVSIKRIVPIAEKEAKEWKRDAYLNNMDFWVIPNDSDLPMRVSLEFATLTSDEWLVLEYHDTEGIIKLTKKMSGSYTINMDKPKIETTKILSDSLDAYYQITDSYWTSSTKRQKDVIYPVVLELNHYHGEKVKWVVFYQFKDGSTNRISMDAYLNQNIRVETSE